MHATPLPLSSESLNAVTEAMGALAMVLTRRLPQADREAMANDLAAFAMAAEEAGEPLVESLLIDLQRAIR